MKVLIYLPVNKLAPVGGKIGVGYNIYEEIKRKNINNIDFLDDIKSSNRSVIHSQKIKWIVSFLKLFISPGKENKDLFSKYDIIHFHSVKDFYSARKSLKSFDGITILTSHSPVPMALEMFEDISNKAPVLANPLVLRMLRRIDQYAFEHADYIMFPCREAEEPYFNNWKQYARIHNQRADSYFYCPTGIRPIQPSRSREEIRKEYGIDNDEFVICYVGRHNKVKGYDILKSLGERILELDDNTSFLICGKEQPIKGISDPKWHEIGWTNDAYSYIAASDVFVLPNRETYFDLIMLEVLCLGKIVIASNTGGNKFFGNNKYPGVLLYNSPDEAIGLLDKVSNMSLSQRRELELLNKQLFESYFTSEKYVERYLKCLEDLK